MKHIFSKDNLENHAQNHIEEVTTEYKFDNISSSDYDDLCALYYVYFNRYNEETNSNRQLEFNYLKIKCEMYKRDLLDTNKDIIKITKIN